MAHAPNLLPLKVLVICLGLVLIGGTVFVFAAIMEKTGMKASASRCKDVTFHIADKGALTGVSPQGDKVQVTLALGSETKVLTVDRCTGALVQSFTVAP